MKEEQKLTNNLTPQSIFYEYLYNSATKMFNLYSLVTLESMFVLDLVWGNISSDTVF